MDQPISHSTKNVTALRWILIIGITIVLNLFFYFAINTVYPEPQYNDFCPAETVNIQPTTKEQCVGAGGQWNENTALIRSDAPAVVTPKMESTSYCDTQFTCRQDFEGALKVYQRNVFIALVVLGIISIVAGFYFSSIAAVALGLSLGGVLSLVIGSMRYWNAMADYVRVIILAAALVTLLWIAIKKFRD
jgi:hypothetical protein